MPRSSRCPMQSLLPVADNEPHQAKNTVRRMLVKLACWN